VVLRIGNYSNNVQLMPRHLWVATHRVLPAAYIEHDASSFRVHRLIEDSHGRAAAPALGLESSKASATRAASSARGE
jgi:hypothetical protein